jgi:hypothetical protein
MFNKIAEEIGNHNLARQGLDRDSYPATMETYLKEQGSNSGANRLSDDIQKLSSICPNTVIIVTGWR